MIRLALACGIAASMPAPPSAAEQAKPWKVSGDLLGAPDETRPDDPDESSTAEDVSGIACATGTGFPRLCLVADDESQGAQAVILRDGGLVAGRFVRLIAAAHKGKPLELDAEGVAYADGAFYVVGSHGRPRHEDGKGEKKIAARARATRNLFQIRFDPKAVDLETGDVKGEPEIVGTNALGRVIAAVPELADFHDEALEDGGLTVEGIAVRDGQVHAGLRGPVLADGSAVVVSVPREALFGGKPAAGQLVRLPLGPDSRGNARGIRDLVAVPDGFLVLAGPMLDPRDDAVAPGDYTIFSWSGRGDPRKRLDLPGFGAKVKPEALLPLDRVAGGQRVLVLFDGARKGGPRPVVLPD